MQKSKLLFNLFLYSWLVVAFGFIFEMNAQGVAINTNGMVADSSAILDASSIVRGFLMPRMTTTQRNAIPNPAEGLMIFNITSGCPNYFSGGFWREWCGLASNVSGTIHCNGLPTAVVDVINPFTGKTWMDRNLGANQVAINQMDTASWGSLFQWGRAADGHQCRNSANMVQLSSVSQPSHGNFIIFPSHPPYDWRTPQEASLWQGVSGLNNPCPNGYRLPTESEINAERLSWSSNNAAGAFGSPLKLPFTGSRSHSNGNIFLEGSHGVYWTNTAAPMYSKSLVFEASSSYIGDNSRGNGLAVRCIKN
jgi:hypothetical protein